MGLGVVGGDCHNSQDMDFSCASAKITLNNRISAKVNKYHNQDFLKWVEYGV